MPELLAATLLKTDGLTRHFKIGGALSRQTLHAVDDVSIAIGEREIVALAGESGSGKSTVARLLARVYRPTSGSVEFAGQPLHVERGAARLADGAIAGSVLTMDQALRNALRMMGVSLSEAVGMLTLNPARAIHLDERKGRLRPGYDADLLLFSSDLTLQATFCRGQVAYATDAWRARFAGL